MRRFKGSISLIVTSLMFVSLGTGMVKSENVVAATQPNTLVAEEVVTISSKADLLSFVKRVNTGETLNGRLTGDIDLTGEQWQSIKNFSGVFDGAGFQISGLELMSSVAWEGFVGTNTGTIKNLTLSGEVTGSGNGLGSIAGWNKGGTIANCISSVTVSNTGSAKRSVGGLVGQNSNDGIISLSQFNGSVKAFSETSGTGQVGGIAGQSMGGTIVGCVNTGEIIGANGTFASHVGGLVGFWSVSGTAGKTAIYNSINSGAISAHSKNANVGGLVGSASRTSSQTGYQFALLNNYNTGTVNAYGDETRSNPIMVAKPSELLKFFSENNYYLADETDYGKGKVSKSDALTPDFVERLNSNDGSDYGIQLTSQERFEINQETYPKLSWQALDETIIDEQDQAYVEQAAKLLKDEWFRLKPDFEQDTNVNQVVLDFLSRHKHADLKVTLKETSDSDYINADGDITYFYADPNSGKGTWFKSVPVVFEIEKNGAVADYDTTAIIHWDLDRLEATTQKEFVDKVDEQAIKGDNIDLSAVESDLILPKIVDGKKWAAISWYSSDESLLKIDKSQEGSVSTMFNPFIGKVKRGEKDQDVILTAVFKNNLTSVGQPDLLITKEYAVKIKAIGAAPKAKMQQLLDENYTLDKITDSVTKKVIDPVGITNDIQFLTPAKTGIPNSHLYKFEVLSHSPTDLIVSGYRGDVYRPLPNGEPLSLNFTVKMSDRSSSIFVTKDFQVTALPLTIAELTKESQLMTLAKSAYFDGLNKQVNSDQDHVTNHLTGFKQVVFAADGKGLDWKYGVKEMVGGGIIPVAIDLAHPSEAWNLFRSSNKMVINHENLLVTQPQYDEKVTIDSVLSSDLYSKYAVRYPEQKLFKSLHRQAISTEVLVLGKDGPNPSEKEELAVSFSLFGDSLHSEMPHSSYESWLVNTPGVFLEPVTVFDIFEKMLTLNHYNYKGSTYISSITTPLGYELSHGDNGSLSGWLYAVNGLMPDIIATDYIVKNNDDITWFYSDDFEKDLRIYKKDEKYYFNKALEKGKLTVHYEDQDGNALSKPEVTSYDLGTAYKTKAQEFDGFAVTDVSGAESGYYNEMPLEVTYVYEKVAPVIEEGKVLVHYQDESGKTLEQSNEIVGEVGDDYATEAVEIADYNLLRVEGAETGQHTKETIDVTYVYEKVAPVIEEGKVLVHYQDESGKTLEQSNEIVGEVGDDYATEAVEIADYDLLRVEGAETGQHTKETIDVTYVYEKVAPVIKEGKVLVHYQDESGNTLEKSNEIVGEVGDDYATEAVEITDYNLLRVEGAETGQHTKETIDVTYVYEKAAAVIEEGKVLVHYQDESGKTLEKSNEIVGEVGHDYATEAVEIADYNLLRVEGAETGQHTKETIDVTYVYEKAKPVITKGKIIIHYRDDKGEKLAKSKELYGEIGKRYDSEQVTIKNYQFVRVEGPAQGEFSNQEIEVAYIYKKASAEVQTGKVLIRHVDKFGRDLIGTVELTGAIDNSYQTEPLAIDGHHVTNIVGNETGKFTTDEQQVIYYYDKTEAVTKGTIRVSYVDPEGKEIAESEELSGELGNSYTLKTRDITGYQYSETTGKLRGIFTADPQTIELIYTKERTKEEPAPIKKVLSHPVNKRTNGNTKNDLPKTNESSSHYLLVVGSVLIFFVTISVTHKVTFKLRK